MFYSKHTFISQLHFDYFLLSIFGFSLLTPLYTIFFLVHSTIPKPTTTTRTSPSSSANCPIPTNSQRSPARPPTTPTHNCCPTLASTHTILTEGAERRRTTPRLSHRARPIAACLQYRAATNQR